MQKTFRTAALALAFLAAPAIAAAQDAPAAATAPEGEIAQIQERLMRTQQTALQDPAIQQAQAEMGQVLLGVMQRQDPSMAEKTARASALQQDVATAREAGDNARLHELAAEAEQLQADFAVARERAMADPEVQTAMAAFQEQVVARMAEVDSETNDLLARLNELEGSRQ